MNTIGQRIKKARLNLGMNQKELAKKAGITQQAISYIENSDEISEPRHIIKIAAALKTTPHYLLEESNFPEFLPLLNWKEFEELCNIKIPINVLSLDKDKFMIPNFKKLPLGCYTLTIDNDAMADRFKQNDIVVVDENKEAVNNSLVVAFDKKSKKSIFRQFLSDGINNYLKPFNSQYQSIEVDKNIKILGVVVASFSSHD